MIRQLCRDIARVFGGQGGVRNFGVIFIVIAGLLLSCCLLGVVLANGTPGRPIAQTTATSTGIAVVGTTVTASPTEAATATSTPSSAGGTVTPSPTGEAPTQPTATNTPAQPTATTPPQPTATNTPPPPTATNTPSSSGGPGSGTATPVCQPSQGVPCGGPGTGGGPGSGPQNGVENGGTLALMLVGLLSLALVAVAVVATLRIRRTRGA